MSYTPQQDTVPAYGGSIFGGRDKRIEINVVGNTTDEVLTALRDAVKAATFDDKGYKPGDPWNGPQPAWGPAIESGTGKRYGEK